MAGNSASSGVSVTSRVLALLGAFDNAHRSLTLSQLARRADLPLATAHRLVAELVAWGALVRVTAYTITQAERMREQLEAIRRDGFSVTYEEMTLGACSAAVPIRVTDGTVAASLGIVVPRLTGSRPSVLPALQVAAQGIGRSIAGISSIQ